MEWCVADSGGSKTAREKKKKKKKKKQKTARERGQGVGTVYRPRSGRRRWGWKEERVAPFARPSIGLHKTRPYN